MSDSFSYVNRRPDMGPVQVRSAAELQPGREYVAHRRSMTPGRAIGVCKEPGDWSSYEFTVRGAPVGDHVRVQYSASSVEENMWLVHAGVLPDDTGRYHRYNWVEDPSKPVLSRTDGITANSETSCV